MVDTGGSVIVPYLVGDERIVWQGQGRRRLWGGQAMPGVIVLVTFVFVGAMLLGLFSFIGTTTPRTNSANPEVFLIIPIILLAIGFAVGLPLLLLGRQLGNAYYFVTSRAALIYSENRWFGRRVTVVPLANLSLLTLDENRDGTGSLLFSTSPYMATSGSRGNGGLWAAALPAFWNIERPREIYQLVRQQMSASGSET